MSNIILDGLMMMVMLFIIIVCYIVLSGPFDDMMTSFNDINGTRSDSYVESGTTLNRIVFTMIFGAMGVIPIIWFIVRVFSREPDWRFK